VDLELAVVLFCTDTGCRVRWLEGDLEAEACYAEPMLEHYITARPGQLVAVDRDAPRPLIVYRWSDVTVRSRDEQDVLTRRGHPVEVDELRIAAFPRIQDMYEQLQEGERVDPKQVVREGYDRVAERYLECVQSERSAVRMRYTALLLERLAPGVAVLDLGCGAGGPTTQALARRFQVTGVDISARSIALARHNVPQARFIRADMAALDFPPCSFDGVAAFYSLIHVPRDEQPGLLNRLAQWLRPGALLVATMGVAAARADYEPDFLGAPMYWSGFDSRTNCRLVENAGLTVIQAREEAEPEHGARVTFLWLVAQRPPAPPCARQQGRRT
jgi:SAM-dependent methyltransferase